MPSDLTVNVVGRLPKQHEPWPANVEDILLGTATKAPTGFVARDSSPGSMPASMAGEYSNLASVAPFVAKQTPRMFDLDSRALRALLGLGSYVPALDAAAFTEEPPAERIGHEAIHRMQMQNFPTGAAGRRAWQPRGKGELAYLDAAGEQQAYKAEELIQARLRRALLARMRAQ